MAVDGTIRFKHRKLACTNFSLDGKIFQAPRKKLVRPSRATANQLPKDLALIDKGIYCREQRLRWNESGIVMPFEATKLYGLLDEDALKAYKKLNKTASEAFQG